MPPQDPAATPLLSVEGLTVEFATPGGPIRAVDGVTFDVAAGRTLAIVGESGSGKSVTAMALLRLTDHTGGRIAAGRMRFARRDGARVDLATADPDTMRAIRGNEIAMIFQEPMTSLNPVFTVGEQITEVITLHQRLPRSAARAQAADLLHQVRLPDARAMLDRYPHQLSGGQRQRVMIAIALSCRPRLLIADEPTTALDVTIQAQILATIRELQSGTGTAVIFITHDMGVVAEMADAVAVFHAGRKVEQAAAETLFHAPTHAYTKALLAAVPRLGAMRGKPAPGPTPSPGTLLQVDGLCVRFPIRGGVLRRVTHRVHAAEAIGFDIHPGETLALVGESGSGKSTIGKTLQQLIRADAGRIRFDGIDIATADPPTAMRLKREIQYIFQDPFGSLDPRKTVGFSIAEPILTHRLAASPAAARPMVAALLARVGLRPEHAARYPHEFSGGQRQRICIARALSCNPRLLIADESVSALDVSVQAQILDLLLELQRERGLAYLFITHDMAVVEKIAHRVAVMQMGQIVELGSRAQVFETPAHPYTRKLLAAVPIPDPAQRIHRPLIEGEVPSPIRPLGDPPAHHRLTEIAPGHFSA